MDRRVWGGDGLAKGDSVVCFFFFYYEMRVTLNRHAKQSRIPDAEQQTGISGIKGPWARKNVQFVDCNESRAEKREW